MNQTGKINFSDWLGVSASTLCIVHCALTPLIFTAKPVFYGMIGKQVHNHGAWAALDYVFLILSLIAVYYSARHTAHPILKWVFWAAWIVFACGLLFEPHTMTSGHWLMYAGSIVLVIAHLINYQYNHHHKIEVSS